MWEGSQGLASQARAIGARHALGTVAEAARSQSEEAYLRIRDRIVCLDMPPGSVVEEGRLRDELEIGRTPIREALQRLAWENLTWATDESKRWGSRRLRALSRAR